MRDGEVLAVDPAVAMKPAHPGMHPSDRSVGLHDVIGLDPAGIVVQALVPGAADISALSCCCSAVAT